ncbi:hypothetical protein LB505_000526 [Fusarium chuoi]|nr:hypothetical protein LB505_000526 [Fusarium chuoi]
MRQAKQNSNIVWVATSDGRICEVDWTTSKTPEFFQTQSKTATAMALVTKKVSGRVQEFIFIAESDKPGRIEVVAYPASTTESLAMACSCLRLARMATWLAPLTTDFSLAFHHSDNSITWLLWITRFIPSIFLTWSAPLT